MPPGAHLWRFVPLTCGAALALAVRLPMRSEPAVQAAKEPERVRRCKPLFRNAIPVHSGGADEGWVSPARTGG